MMPWPLHVILKTCPGQCAGSFLSHMCSADLAVLDVSIARNLQDHQNVKDLATQHAATVSMLIHAFSLDAATLK